jgi:hypothetical protein
MDLLTPSPRPKLLSGAKAEHPKTAKAAPVEALADSEPIPAKEPARRGRPRKAKAEAEAPLDPPATPKRVSKPKVAKSADAPKEPAKSRKK